MNCRLVFLTGLLCWPLSAGAFETRLQSRAETLLRYCSASALPELTRAIQNEVAKDVLKEVPADVMADYMMRQCLDHGGLEIQTIHDSSPTVLRATVLGKKSKLGLEFSLRQNSQGKLEMPTLDPLPLHGLSIPENLSDEILIQTIRSDVDRLGESGIFSGIVLVARDSEIILSETRRFANRERKKPITRSTQFTLASLSKLFTAVAVGQLVDQKKLTFDDKVGIFFPDYPNKTVRDQATVSMLLAHTAGLGEILDKRPPAMLKRGWTKALEFVPLSAEDELEFMPGSRQGYSNAGLALAGAIVEKASGLDYPSYLRQRIFETSGMKASDPNNIPFKGPDLVTPYTRSGNSSKLPVWTIASADLGSPAGGAIATADDLVKFAHSLRQGKLLEKSTLARMKQPAMLVPGSHGYGLGMSTEKIDGQEWIGHNGGYDGVSTELSLMPDGPYTLVILENRDPPASEWLGTRIRALLSAQHKKAAHRN